MPIRLCLEPGCPYPSKYRGRCASHAASRDRETHPNKAIYNSVKWVFTRRRQLFEEPLCAVCGEIATDVDHINPIAAGGGIWAPINLQSLCRSCHATKTRSEQYG